MRSHLRALGVLHARLHRLPIAGVPLPYERPMVRQRLDEGRAEALAKGCQRELAWLDEHARIVEEEIPVLTHNDFHPLNVLIASDGAASVIDWSDSRLGDRHHDVARTSVLFWIASIAAKSSVERMFLRLMRGRMTKWHQDGYRTQLPLQPERMTYWQAFHSLSGMMLVRALHEDHDDPAIKDSSRERVPPELANELQEYFWKRARRLS
jgi:aminoglycoside phosphotransferase (APT) family kinase protein